MLRRSQRDFEDEIKSHLQLEIDRLKTQGMSDHDARLAAHKHFGSLTVAEDRYYHGRTRACRGHPTPGGGSRRWTNSSATCAMRCAD